MLVGVEERLEWILSGIGRLGTQTLALGDAHGRTLAEAVRARCDLPPWDNSAMDGYALHSADVAHASAEHPVPLTVTGEVLAGSAADPPVAAGCAVRIMTGAPLPTDCDTVIPVERTAADTDGPWADRRVTVLAAAAPGANVRRRGEDTPAAAEVAAPGDLLTSARIAAIAASGTGRVEVATLPRVAVIAAGAELCDPAAPLRRGEIPESNTLLISGLLRECGITPVAVHRCTDDEAAMTALLRDLGDSCDVIVSTGGVGPGRRDVMRLVLHAEPGVSQVRMAIRPGQPHAAGRLAAGPYLFALPGNPVSAAVCFELLVRPALLTLQGRTDPHRRRTPALAAIGWRGVPGRLQVMPVTVARHPSDAALSCRPAVDSRGFSHAVGAHGTAHGYALVGPDRGDVVAGEGVDLLLTGSAG